jgi:hypothetical protein
MKRFRRNLAVVLVALAPASATAVLATSASAAQPRAMLTGSRCQTALDPPARAISVTAVMRPLPQTAKLELEFQLLERAGGAAAWTAVPAPGFGTWLSPASPPTLGQQPGDVWKVTKPVADLDAPASYRFEVSFRWLGADGTVLGSATELGKVCREPELRPDLVVQSVKPVQTRNGQTVYAAAVTDTGASGAGPVTVQLSSSGEVATTKTVPHIAPHQTVVIRLLGPVCNPASPPTVTVDPNNQLDVSSRSQATLAAQCQASAGAGQGLANGIPVSN